MGIFDRAHRHAIWTIAQHPLKHTLSDFAYVNPALPGVTNVNSALNYMINVLYPVTKPNVATPGALPGAGNTLGDYRVVDDDGDGKSAGYRWEQREGDVAAKWYKIFDVDWSTDAILAAVTDVTDDKYFYSKGKSDLDDTGALVAGLYAGQKVYGGALAGENLTLNANSGDGVGAESGFVQVDSPFRPTIDNTFDLSTATERWKDAFFAGTITVGTLSLSSNTITDSSGSISFADENLNTTGTITGGSLVADDTSDTVTLIPGSYTDSTGAVDFGSANLSSTGTLGVGVATFTDNTQTVIIDPDNGAARASITSSLGAIDFNDEDLYTTGTLNVGSITSTQLNVDNLRLDGNTLSSTDTNGNILLVPDGTGLVDVQKVLQTLNINTTGTIGVTGQIDVDNITLNGNTLSITDLNGSLNLVANGTGTIVTTNSITPSVTGADSLGSASLLYDDLFISGGIRNASNEIAVGTLLSFRSGVWRDLGQTQPAQDGDALFFDFANGVWLASTPDSEVDHTTIANITTGDAGHTQFAMLAGRAGGQILQGGTAAAQNLTLESTSHATKGSILITGSIAIAPSVDASFSGTWSGLDVGASSNNFRDFYSKGEFKGFRLENFTSGTLPSASAQNIGRLVYATDNSKAYVDTGTAFKVLGVSKFVSDEAFDGVVLFKNVDVSSDITDARNANYVLLDNANDFEKMGVTVKATSASIVRIETNIPLPAGSYRLIVIE